MRLLREWLAAAVLTVATAMSLAHELAGDPGARAATPRLEEPRDGTLSRRD